MTLGPEPRRNGKGQYLIRQPDGSDAAYSRVSTRVKALADNYGLTKYIRRQVMVGVAGSPDLIAMIAATPVDDTATLDKIADDAERRAGGDAAANLGSAFHQIIARRQMGETLNLPAQVQADVDACLRALDDAELVILPQYIERTGVIDELRIAGTLDFVAELAPTQQFTEAFVGDFKTGKNITYIARRSGAARAFTAAFKRSSTRRLKSARKCLRSTRGAASSFTSLPDRRAAISIGLICKRAGRALSSRSSSLRGAPVVTSPPG